MSEARIPPLLPFQKHIVENVHDPSSSDFLILARGLGLRKIVCTLLQIYDGPQNLVILVNAGDEEVAIGEQLGILGCRNPGLRVVGWEMGRKDRQNLYKQGGLISVTSRILVVDMLQADIPIGMITGMVVLHAEKVTSLSLEAFIIRLYREKNSVGFVKAFSDAPEHITTGLYPLKSIMKELQLRKVHIYPRFHEEIRGSLERRKADVIELLQGLSEPMKDIHQAIIQCMNATLSELKRSNTMLDLDDLTVENAYFRSFDAIVRRQLDPVWHRVGPKTKQLVSDLAVLRNLLNYLLSYDPLAFHAYLETIIEANSSTNPGSMKQNQSPWLFMDAAHIIFQTAKRRCYLTTSVQKSKQDPKPAEEDQTEYDIDLVDDEDAWAALDEIEGATRSNETVLNEGQEAETSRKKRKKPWLPDGIDPVLEELPKWSLLADILQEIEEEMIRLDSSTSFATPGSNNILVMCSSPRTCEILGEYLNDLDRRKTRDMWGRRMMERRLRLYLWWKAKLDSDRKQQKQEIHSTGKEMTNKPETSTSETNKSAFIEAIEKKEALRKERRMNRRRVRGSPIITATSSRTTPIPGLAREETPSIIKTQESGMSGKEREKLGILTGEGEMRVEANNIAKFLASQKDAIIIDDDDDDDDELEVINSSSKKNTIDIDEEVALSLATEKPEIDPNYGLLEPEQTVIFRAYSDDDDDQLLEDLSPRFIVMFEPNLDFIRRIECYRSSNPGLAVRAYFMIYENSCEEHKFLAGIRREKEAFTRLIKERGSMFIALGEDKASSSGDSIIKSISTRIGGGQQAKALPSQVIVDMREFRSTLPSLLHAAKILVIPATLTVGDYILAPDICVERKSIPDLVQSFASGRLYTQCELMPIHYKQPILLIEFEEHKSFSLESVNEINPYAKSSSKYPAKKKSAEPSPDSIVATTIQAKLVLLTLSFPRLRILWSSSPYATANMFNDLKTHHPEPDPSRAVAIGAEEDPEAGAGINHAAEELLRSLPGITAKNVKYVMSKVGSVREFCGLSLSEVQAILGNEPGKACWDFMHFGE